MLFESPQLLFMLFVLGIALVAYEMRQSLLPATCPECPHCRARADEVRRRQSQIGDPTPPPDGWRGRDDEDRRP